MKSLGIGFLFCFSLSFSPLANAGSGAAAEPSGSLSKRLVPRKIYGQIFCTEKKVKRPLKGAKLRILDYDKLVAKIQTKADGRYELNLKVKEGERYTMEVSTVCGDTAKDFLIETEQESNILNFSFAKE